MKPSRLTRPPTIAVALASLVIGVIALVAPPASAEGEVTVTWPEITAFNPDLTDYVIDVQWDGEGSLFLGYMSDSETLSLDELAGAGIQAVDFPVHDTGGSRVLRAIACPRTSYGAGCRLVGQSPELHITRDDPNVPGESAVSVTWPSTEGMNPEIGTFVPEVEWDERGSLYYVALRHDGQQVIIDEVRQPGPFPVDFPVDGSGDYWDMLFAWCPGEVFESPNCTTIESLQRFGVWRAMDVSFAASTGAVGPSKPFSLEIHPAGETPVEVQWELREQDVVVAEGVTQLAPGDPLPALGPQPQLEEGASYRLVATVRSQSETYGSFTAEASTGFTWDSENLSQLVIRACCRNGQVDTMDAFYPEIDDYYDRLLIEVPRTPDDGTADISVTDADGGEIFGTAYIPYDGIVRWDGHGLDGRPAPAGVYTVRAVLTDPAGNVVVHTRDVRLSREAITRKRWRGIFVPRRTMVQQVDVECGRLRDPARSGWPGSLGLDSPVDCGHRPGLIALTHRVRVPMSFTRRYGRSRITVVGAAARNRQRARLHVSYDAEAPYDYWGFKAAPEYGRHVGEWSEIPPQFDRGRSYLHWLTTAMRGAKYDVRRFIVEVEYDVLE